MKDSLLDVSIAQNQDLKSEMEAIFMKNKGTYNLLKKYIDLPPMVTKRKSWKRIAKDTVVTKGGTIAALNKLTLFVLSSDSEDSEGQSRDQTHHSQIIRERQEQLPIQPEPPHKIKNKLHVAGRFNLRQLSPVMSHVISQSKENGQSEISKFSLNTPYSTISKQNLKTQDEEQKITNDLRDHIIRSRTSESPPAFQRNRANYILGAGGQFADISKLSSVSQIFKEVPHTLESERKETSVSIPDPQTDETMEEKESQDPQVLLTLGMGRTPVNSNKLIETSQSPSRKFYVSHPDCAHICNQSKEFRVRLRKGLKAVNQKHKDLLRKNKRAPQISVIQSQNTFITRNSQIKEKSSESRMSTFMPRKSEKSQEQMSRKSKDFLSVIKARAKMRKSKKSLFFQEGQSEKKQNYRVGQGISKEGAQHSPAFGQVFQLKHMLDKSSQQLLGKKFHDRERKALDAVYDRGDVAQRIQKQEDQIMREFYKNQRIKNYLKSIFQLEQGGQLSPRKIMSEIKQRQRDFLKQSEKNFKKNVILTKSLQTESKGSTNFNPSVALQNNLEQRMMQIASRRVQKSSIASTLLTQFQRVSSRPYTPTLLTYDPKEDEELVMFQSQSNSNIGSKIQEPKWKEKFKKEKFPPLSKFPQNHSSTTSIKIRKGLVDKTSAFSQPKSSVVVVDSQPRQSVGSGNFVKVKRSQSRKGSSNYRSDFSSSVLKQRVKRISQNYSSSLMS